MVKKNVWRARWKDNDGNEKSKSFTCKKYGYKVAKNMAIQSRKKAEAKYGYLQH